MELINERKKIILDLMNDKNYVPMKIKELAIILNVKKEDRGLLEIVLNELINEGKISVSKRGKYSIAKETLVTGIFTAHEKGYGFVTVEGEEEDYFIPAANVNNAFHHDTVLVAVLPEDKTKNDGTRKRRKEGKIIKIISHEITEVVGLFEKSKNFGYVLPDNQKIVKDIYIPLKASMGAVNGHKVVAKITDYGKEGRKPEGKIVEIIGHVNDPGVDILSIVKAYDIPTEFPEDVMEQIENIPDYVREEEKNGRKDIRNWQTVTIDGEDAKDLDDAITISKKNGVYTLGVHIADVSNYVTENSPLDKEARKRATSVYLVDRVIPMLPHKLSNGICSLNQGEDRLALSCIMEIDENGNIISHEIVETLINVDRRMSYTQVRDVLIGEKEACEKHKDFISMFKLMKELSDILRKKRYGRGAINFEFPECKIKLDDKGRVISIEPYERNSATKIIEDFMLMANETVAEEYYWQELPFVYRNHDKPDVEKMTQLATFINNFGYHIKMMGDEIHPKELQKLLESVEGTSEEALISRITLRSMKRAEYTPECKGHFGLSAKYYCHFTSPIRRYPDLQIHRIIKENIHGKLNEKYITHYNTILPDITKNCSINERRADDAERDTEKLKKVEYMRSYIGEEFEGVISSVTGWGMYVELPNTIEGMVHVSNMEDDHYIYDEPTYSLVGEHTKKTYKLGQSVKVRVVHTDKMTKTIDFVLA